eukprot:COSAG02_NODE_1201_length_13902_cov_4.383033_5_plen_1396_part_00
MSSKIFRGTKKVKLSIMCALLALLLAAARSQHVCSGSNYSVHGRCEECAEPNVVDSEHLKCYRCQGGTGAAPDRIGCAICTGRNFSTCGICQECPLPYTVNPERTMCTPCPSGKGPNADFTECVNCTGRSYSRTGVCQECPASTVVNPERTGCTSCPAGRGPNDDHSDCEICTGANFSADGVCTPCDRFSIETADHKRCERCIAGKYPDNEQKKCVFCNAGEYSKPGGGCQTCSAPNVVNDDRTECTGCKEGQGMSKEDAQCHDCTGNTYSHKGLCETCIEGNAVDAEHRTCFRCTGGKEPDPTGIGCVNCTAGHYSVMGQCQPCPHPSVVNADHTTCSPCPAGKGPDADYTNCIDCKGNEYSISGMCEPCPPGTISNKNHTGWSLCGERKAYVKNYSETYNVCGCAPGYYDASTTLILCLLHGYSQDDKSNAFETMCESPDMKSLPAAGHSQAKQPVCIPCPDCIDCSQVDKYDAVPALRDGYRLSEHMQIIEGDSSNCADSARSHNGSREELGTQERSVYLAFLCEQHTAVQASSVRKFGYYTNEMANIRCDNRCNLHNNGFSSDSKVGALRSACPVKLQEVSVAQAKRANGKAAYSRANRTDASLYSGCTIGYAGTFCQSCARGFHGDPSLRGKCLECDSLCAPFTSCWIWVPFLLLFPALLLTAVRLCFKFSLKCCAKTAKQPVSHEPTLQLSQRLLRPDTMFGSLHGARMCGISIRDLRAALGLLRFALGPPLRVVVTYFQVTGQLSDVLGVHYPTTFSNTTGHFTWTQNFFVFIFRRDCIPWNDWALGSFKYDWGFRVVAQPMFCGALIQLYYWYSRIQNAKATRAQLRQERTQNLLRGLFLCYPGIVNKCFSALNCIYDSENSQVLIDDDRVQCPQWISMAYIGDPDFDMAWIRLMSVCVLVLVGVGAPFVFALRVVRVSGNGEKELRELNPILECASQELPDDPEMRRTVRGDAIMLSRVQDRVEVLWKRSWRYWLRSKLCCWCCSHEIPDEFRQKTERDVRNKLHLSWRAEEITEDVQAAFIECTKLQTFSAFVEAYKPGKKTVYWEAVDMLRKFCLVGVVVMFGRDSGVRIFVSMMFSFFFFAAQLTMWPMKADEDNILRASCEIHVFWTITTAILLHTDFDHQAVVLDWALVITFLICVPLMFVYTVSSKFLRGYTSILKFNLDRPLEVPVDPRRSSFQRNVEVPVREFWKFRNGLASEADRRNIRDYYNGMLSSKPMMMSDEGLSPIQEMLIKLLPGMSVDALASALQELSAHNVAHHETCQTLKCWDKESGMQLFVQAPTGATISVWVVDSADTVAEVKRQVHEKQDVDVDQLQLTFGGQVLEDERMLRSYNIGEGSNLQLGETLITFKVLSRWVYEKKQISSEEPGVFGLHRPSGPFCGSE